MDLASERRASQFSQFAYFANFVDFAAFGDYASFPGFLPILLIFYGDIAAYLEDGIVQPGRHNDMKDQIHADFVRRSISARQPNPNLCDRAPPIHRSEARLPRAYRSAMAQLRSGYSSSLNNYLVRVGRADASICPTAGPC